MPASPRSGQPRNAGWTRLIREEIENRRCRELDLLAFTREFVDPAVSRAGLGRCLRRRGVSDMRNLVRQNDSKLTPSKAFKAYEPGFVHIDIEYLPQMPDESQRRYLFVAIERATRWVFIEIHVDLTKSDSVDFLTNARAACPVEIT